LQLQATRNSPCFCPPGSISNSAEFLWPMSQDRSFGLWMCSLLASVYAAALNPQSILINPVYKSHCACETFSIRTRARSRNQWRTQLCDKLFAPGWACTSVRGTETHDSSAMTTTATSNIRNIILMSGCNFWW
jgi:hypothetical protein